MGAGVGLAVAPRLEAAAVASAAAAAERCGAERPALALAFISGDPGAAIDRVLDALRRTTRARVVAGCTGAGVLTGEREVEGEPAVAVLVADADGLLVAPALVDAGAEPAAAARVVAERLGPTVAERGAVLLFADPRGFDARGLLGELDRALGRAPVAGALAGGPRMLEFAGEEWSDGGLAAVGLSGPAAYVGVTQGCMPIGEPFVVTRAEGNVVQRIAGRPAVDVLREALATLDDPAGRVRQAGLFAGLAMDPAKSPLERGDFLVRNLLGADPSAGTVAVAEAVRVGQTIQFQIRDRAASRADLAAMLDEVAARLGGRRPLFGCYFNCAGRGRSLFGTADHDVTMIHERLGAFPLVGLFGNGEIAPVAGRTHLHAYTGVLALFAASGGTGAQ